MKTLLKVIGWLLAVTLITLYTFRTPDSDPKAMIAKYGAPPSKFLKLPDGQIVHMRDEGPADAPVLVLLHGSNADLHTWDAWTDQLKGKYRVIRYDTIGHGLTGASANKDYSLFAMSGLVDRVTTALNLPKFVLVGNSMGGAVAANYAIEHADRLAGLVLIDAGGAPKKNNDRGNVGFTLAATPGVSTVMQEVTPRWIIARSLTQTVSNKAVVTDAVIDRYWELLRYPGNREATMIRFSTPRGTFDPARLGTIKVPTLILWGEEDPLIGLDGAHFFQRAIPGSTLITYPGIGHIPMEEAAQRSAGDLETWLAAHGVPGKPG